MRELRLKAGHWPKKKVGIRTQFFFIQKKGHVHELEYESMTLIPPKKFLQIMGSQPPKQFKCDFFDELKMSIKTLAYSTGLSKCLKQ